MPHYPKPCWHSSKGYWYVTIDGKQHSLGKDRTEAFEQYHQLMLDAGKEMPEDTESTSFAVVVIAFLEHAAKLKRYQTHKIYLTKLLTQIPPSTDAVTIKPQKIHDAIRSLELPDGAARELIVSARQAFSHALRMGLIAKDPLVNLPRPESGSRETFLNATQVEAILAQCKGPFRDFVEVMIEQGVRPGDVRKVEAKHVNFDLGLWIFQRKEHKTGKKTKRARVIYMTPKTTEICKRLVDEHPTGHLFRNDKGEPWTVGAVRRRFERLRKRKELKDVIPPDTVAYTMRHSYAAMALTSGEVSLAELVELMGHSGPRMIIQNYGHLAKQIDHMKKVAAKAGSHASSPKRDTRQGRGKAS